ncbi:MAG: sulfotransferase [Sphingomonas sp.]
MQLNNALSKSVERGNRKYMKRFHFISGLPRSGSTLLAGILNQNPGFLAGMSSPVYRAFCTLQKDFSGDNEFSFDVTNTQRENILRGILENYYGVHPEPVVIDTSRGWTSKTAAIAEIFPAAKFICMVRPVVEIIESIERIIRSNPLTPSRLFNFEPNTNVYSRVDSMLLPNGLIGSSMNNLKEAFYGPESDRLMVISYQRLISDTTSVIEAIYDFLQEPLVEHDLENIEYSALKYDEHIGLPGLHTVRKRIEPLSHQSVIPSDISARFRGAAFWTSPNEPSKSVKMI